MTKKTNPLEAEGDQNLALAFRIGEHAILVYADTKCIGSRVPFRPCLHAMERRTGCEKPPQEKHAAQKCFQVGKSREVWREAMLDVRLEGESFALPYAHLNHIKLDGERAVILSFSSHLVKIEGVRLRALYDALTDQAVRFVTVAAGGQAGGLEPSSDPRISSIDLIPLGQHDAAVL